MKTLPNTLQVRKFMKLLGVNTYGLYTNKTSGDKSNNRRVKCYLNGRMDIVEALQKAYGVENVKVTTRSRYVSRSGIIVNCVLAV